MPPGEDRTFFNVPKTVLFLFTASEESGKSLEFTTLTSLVPPQHKSALLIDVGDVADVFLKSFSAVSGVDPSALEPLVPSPSPLPSFASATLLLTKSTVASTSLSSELTSCLCTSTALCAFSTLMSASPFIDSAIP